MKLSKIPTNYMGDLFAWPNTNNFSTMIRLMVDWPLTYHIFIFIHVFRILPRFKRQSDNENETNTSKKQDETENNEVFDDFPDTDTDYDDTGQVLKIILFNLVLYTLRSNWLTGPQM